MPFTSADFLDVFEAYNMLLWPGALALWMLSAVVLIATLRAREPPHRLLAALLAVHWAWSALAYHLSFFTRINAAAWLFAGLFLIEAVLFARAALGRAQLRFTRGRSARHWVAGALAVFSLLYPAVNAAQGFAYPRMATFGVPCPTTILTLALLLVAEPSTWRFAAIPVLWALVGGSAAFLLDVRADLMLLVAAAFLAGRLIAR